VSTEGWTSVIGDTPLIATAIHHGHGLRPQAQSLMALKKSDRLREEDPHTGHWTAVAETRIVVERSRFEADLNRPREKAVYRRPEDAWGLAMWKEEPDQAFVDESLSHYDSFYDHLRSIFTETEKRHGRFVVLDLHSYNHRRNGPDGAPADPSENPEVNVGTGSLARERWAPLVDRFIGDLRSFDFGGRSLDVRENVRFQGGWMSRWTHENFPRAGCALAIEFKKFFMDEWSGEVLHREHDLILRALRSTVSGIHEELQKLPVA
jgi:N-formylglutamate deformylase